MTEISHLKFTLEACKPPPWNLLTLHNFNHTWFNLHNNIRTASRTQEHLQRNLHLQLLNMTKWTNEISPKANPFVDRAILYFLQQISLILIKKYSQNRRNKIWEWEVRAEAEKSKERRAKRSNGRVGESAAARGVRTIFAARSLPYRNRRVRQQVKVADVAPRGPLASGGCDRWAGVRAPPRKARYRVRRMWYVGIASAGYEAVLLLKICANQY
jgi:hypothetical protein